jgi:transposase
MAKPLVSDALWEIVEPLLPPPKPRRYRYPGRKPIENRRALTGILFVLKSGIPWEMLPQEMGCGSGMTCWRRLRDWQEAGVWEKLHATLLAKLRAADKIDWSRAVVDSASVRAVGGGGENRSQSSGQAQAGQQAPPHHRRQRHPPCHNSDRSEPARHYAVAASG